MTLTEIRVHGYRSIRDLEIGLGRVTVVVGPNGCGKTNLYRALGLVRAAAEGRLGRAIAEEGGMPSLLWAGGRKKDERARVEIGVQIEELGYEIACGLMPKDPSIDPETGGTLFVLDPEVKEERVTYRDPAAPAGKRRPSVLLERRDRTAWARDAEGERETFPLAFSEGESVLSALREPQRFPAVTALRGEILAWRFYHGFPSDAAAPARQPQVGVRTPALDPDGRDLAAALRTIVEVGDRDALAAAVDGAFPGTKLEIDAPGGRFSLALRMPGFARPFAASELSDGTLRYLCLVAALLAPRRPPLLAFNEPETSLHPDLLAPLARLVAVAARDAQAWIVTHSEPLASLLEEECGAMSVRLEKQDGETVVAGRR